MYCSKCGKEVEVSSQYCKHCGARLEDEASESAHERAHERAKEYGEDVPTYEKPKVIPLDMMERNERIVFETHPSKMESFFKYIAGAVLLLAGGIAILTVLSWEIFGIVLIVVGLVIALAGYLKWRSVIYALTTNRIIVLKGIFAKHEHECRLDKVQDIMMNISLKQRMYNYGNIYITTAGTSHVEIKWLNIPDPRKKQKLLRTLLAR